MVYPSILLLVIEVLEDQWQSYKRKLFKKAAIIFFDSVLLPNRLNTSL